MKNQLDPAVRAVVDDLNSNPVMFENMTTAEQHVALAVVLARLQPGPAPAFEGTIRDDFVIAGDRKIPVRRYHPDDQVDADSVVIYYHGGGWVLGNLDSADRFARVLSTMMGTRVVSVDYRLASESPFPAAFDDAYAVVATERAEGASWIGVAGDSAGGNLAAAVAIAMHRKGRPVDAQLLIYPCLDGTCSSPSHQRFAEGYVLTESVMRYYWDTYAGSSDRDDERLSPSVAVDLAGLAPAVIATAGFDPLIDEAAAYAQRLIAAGVRTTYLPFNDLVHGFIDFTDRAAVARTARDALIEAFSDLHHHQLAAR